MNFAAIGLGIATIAALGAVFFIKRTTPQQPRQVKAVFFGLYFWGLVFLQLLVVGLGYYLI